MILEEFITQCVSIKKGQSMVRVPIYMFINTPTMFYCGLNTNIITTCDSPKGVFFTSSDFFFSDQFLSLFYGTTASD